MFAFLTAAIAIAAAGLVTVAVIAAAWLLRQFAPNQTKRKAKRRSYNHAQGEQTADTRQTYGQDSPFHVLGFQQPPNSFAELRSAFLRACNATHPDSNPNDEQAAQKFDQVKKSFDQVGTPDRFEKYLRRNPPDKITYTVDGGQAEVVSARDFMRKFASLKAKWQRQEFDRSLQLEQRLLTSNSHNRRNHTSSRSKRKTPKNELLHIEDVVFREADERFEIAFIKMFDCLICIDTKESFYEIVRFLLEKNGFKDTFSEVRGNSACVTFIGDLPGNWIFPKPIRVMISHDDQPSRLFTRLWDLGLYRGPKVVRP